MNQERVVQAQYRCPGVYNKLGLNGPHTLTWTFEGVQHFEEIICSFHQVKALLVSLEKTISDGKTDSKKI